MYQTTSTNDANNSPSTSLPRRYTCEAGAGAQPRRKQTLKAAMMQISHNYPPLRAETHATQERAHGPDEKVVRLTEMGFEAEAASAALFKANGDEQVCS